MLKCREVTALASDWLDGDLTTAQKLKVRLHLMMCRHCRNLVDGLATTERIIRDRLDAELPIPAELQQRTTEAIEARLRTDQSGRN
ncbi:putative zinc finger protein [Halospina denitrificans]|uniref:Putative zinc finger protein n=1 Tax=Halospina denitrificans TaxID=332522 RepID=A0A4R7K020_9GAMM|nr:zf-HC2 domain-containing protein [Halospina denitrificans]TDT44152.1 putative zinc finger protein [Halospina denitrificans]